MTEELKEQIHERVYNIKVPTLGFSRRDLFNIAMEYAEPREKRIAELEKENEYFKDLVYTNSAEWEEQGKRVCELEKENAELKGIKDVATLIRANNDTVTTLMQLNNMLVSKRQQLTEAKEIIKIMKHLLFDVWGYIAIPLEKRVNNFLKQSNL